MSILKFPTKPRLPEKDPEWMWDVPEQLALADKALRGEGDEVENFVAKEIMPRLYIPGHEDETVGEMNDRGAFNFFCLCKMLRRWQQSGKSAGPTGN